MMYPERLKKDPSKRTPQVLLEPGRIFIMGRSIPDNPGDFFRPVHEWISAYALHNKGKTRIDMGFEYINTSSTKWIFAILKELAAIRDLDKIASVTWYYEEGDDDMLDLGFILKSLLNTQFVLMEVEEMNDERFARILSGSGQSIT